MSKQPTSKRFEPSSRTFLIGEQPNPWELLHRQDKTSRHRGAELRRRYGLSGGTSLFNLFASRTAMMQIYKSYANLQIANKRETNILDYIFILSPALGIKPWHDYL